jgi:hypothetical protein
VNGSLTWSFPGHEINVIDDWNLLVAYCGWAWLFTALSRGDGAVATDFMSDGQEASFVSQKQREGWSEIQVKWRYKIGELELFEFTGVLNGSRAKGAGGMEHDVSFREGEPCFNLPSIYFLLGPEVMLDMH